MPSTFDDMFLVNMRIAEAILWKNYCTADLMIWIWFELVELNGRIAVWCKFRMALNIKKGWCKHMLTNRTHSQYPAGNSTKLRRLDYSIDVWKRWQYIFVWSKRSHTFLRCVLAERVRQIYRAARIIILNLLIQTFKAKLAIKNF